MRPQCWLLALAVSGALLAGCDSSTNKATGARDVEPVTLTLANPYPGDEQIGEWVQAVERLSRGAVRIEVHGEWRSGELDADRGMLGDVRAGRVDLAHIPAYAWDTLGVKSFDALEAPFLVDSFELQKRVVTGEVGASALAGVRSAGVEAVGLLPGPLKRPVGIDRVLRGRNAYDGASIALRPSVIHEATFQALGAQVVTRALDRPLPSGVDGSEADLAQLDREPFRSRVRSVTANLVLWPRPTTLVMNRDSWQRLTGGQRAILADAARAAVASVMRRERNYERGGWQLLCERGFPILRASAGEVAELRRGVVPVYRALAGDRARRLQLEQIRDLKAGLAPDAIPPCARKQTQQPAAGAAPLVGRWEVRATRALLAAARREQGESVEENWGDITLVLGADGRFELLNDRFPGQPVGAGTWSARGDVVALAAGESIEAGAGEIWRYRWTLFRGSLVLRKLSVAPTALTVAPLRRH